MNEKDICSIIGDITVLAGAIGVTQIEVKAQWPGDFNRDTQLLKVMPDSQYFSPADLDGKKVRLPNLETHKGGA